MALGCPRQVLAKGIDFRGVIAAEMNADMFVQLSSSSDYPILNRYSSREFTFPCHFSKRAELAHDSNTADSAVLGTQRWLENLGLF